MEAVAVRSEAVDGSRPPEAVTAVIMMGKVALPNVAGIGAGVGRIGFSPRKASGLEPTTRGVLPLGFGWQPPAGPSGKRTRIIP